ncbi:MAG: hypothetical protein ACRBDL_01730 [Alphaproteobacteria bacterium]
MEEQNRFGHSNTTISAEENAEIDAALARMQEEGMPDPLFEAYKTVRDLKTKDLSSESLNEQEITSYVEARKSLDELLWQKLSGQEGILSDYIDPDTNTVVNARDTSLKDIPPIPENLGTIKSRNNHVIEQLIQNTPSMKGFTIDDAVNLASGGDTEMATRNKFKDANPEVMMAMSHLWIDSKMDELQKTHPEFAQKHERLATNFAELASINIFYATQESSAHKNWSLDRQEPLINAIVNNQSIAGKLQEIKSPDHIYTGDELKQQYVIRQQLCDDIATEFAKAFDLKTLDKGDMHFTYRSLASYGAGEAMADMHTTVPGIKDDESILISYHPVADLLRTHKEGLSDSASVRSFLKTTFEELQHASDNIYGDMLLNGELPQDHPSFNHASMIILNTLNYSSPDVDHNAYKTQYLERSAKSFADDLAFEISFRLDPNGVAPPTSGVQPAILQTEETIDPDTPPGTIPYSGLQAKTFNF